MNKILSSLVVLSLMLSGVAVLRPQVIERTETQFGVAGPDINSTWIRFGGLRLENRGAKFGVGTTTPCVLRAPTDATSTLAYASLTIDNASSTATTWAVGKDIATSANNGEFATTTKISGPFTLGSGAQGTLVASTTPVNGGVVPVVDSTVTFAPGEYVVWSVAGLTHIGLSSTEMSGKCNALFMVDSEF